MTFIPPAPESGVDVLKSSDYPEILQGVNNNLKPSAQLDKTYIAKDGTGLNITGSSAGLSLVNSRIIFVPVQYVTEKTVNVDATAVYEVEYNGTIGGGAQNHLAIKLGGIVPSGSYVFLDSISVTSSTDNEGNPVYCSVKYVDMLNTNNLEVYTVNSDSTSVQKTRKFKLYIVAKIGLTNTALSGWGQLFPV